MIKELSMDFDVKECCEALRVSRSGYYRWRRAEPSRREKENPELVEQIREVFEANKTVRDFADKGFRLIGGRLDYINGREVAALVCQRRLHIINLFIWPLESTRNTAAESFAKDGYNVLHWEGDGFAFWAVSDVNAEDLRAFAGLETQQS
jgi:anti-sigma factor RsiW